MMVSPNGDVRVIGLEGLRGNPVQEVRSLRVDLGALDLSSRAEVLRQLRAIPGLDEEELARVRISDARPNFGRMRR